MTDPRLLSIVSVIFTLMAAYSLYAGSKQMRVARLAGRPIRWYRQLSLLTGIEYALLTFVFLLRLATMQGTLAPALNWLIGPLYFVLLIAAAVIAGLVIRRIILNTREMRASRQSAAAPSLSALQAQDSPAQVLSRKQQEERAQRQRDRRKKAAAERRRRAGRA